MSIVTLTQKTCIREQYLKRIETSEAKKLSSYHISIFANVFQVEPTKIFNSI